MPAAGRCKLAVSITKACKNQSRRRLKLEIPRKTA